MSAYKKFPNGGFWVKKVIQHLGVFQEAVLGPYTYDEANHLAERWKSIFKFEGKEVVKVLSFKDLLCNRKSYIPEIDQKWRWKAPLGSGLICLIHKYYPFMAYTNEEAHDPSFQRFWAYAETAGITNLYTKFKIQPSGNKELLIFYNPDDTVGYRRAYVAYKFLDNLVMARQSYVNWCMDTILGVEPEDERPLTVPGYIERLEKECYPTNMDFFKEQYEKEGNVIRNLFNKLWKCSPDDKKTVTYLPDEKYEVIELDLVFGGAPEEMSRGGGIQRMLFERSGKKYNIILNDYDDSFSIGVYDIDTHKGTGEMIIHLSPEGLDIDDETIFISRTLRDGRFFTKIDVIGGVLLFICKCLHMKKIWIKDKQDGKCPCGQELVALFINPVRYLAGYGSIYESLGFVNEQEEEMRKIVELYREKELPIVSEANTLEDETVVNYLKIESLAKMYLDKSCAYENMCSILTAVGDEISERISPIYHLNLEEMEMSYYKNFF